MKKKIFIINGSGGVGKDTFVSLCNNRAVEITGNTTAIVNYSSVDKIKEIAKIIGWNGKKTEKDRKFLSDLKLLCTEYNDMPFQSICDKIDEFIKSDSLMLFIHIREPKEINKVVKTYPQLNIKTILVKRDSIGTIKSNMADANVYNYNYDIIIYNSSTLEILKTTADNFINLFINADWNDVIKVSCIQNMRLIFNNTMNNNVYVLPKYEK